MPQVGNKRNIMNNTTLNSTKAPDVLSGNSKINEDEVFDKSKKQPVSLEITPPVEAQVEAPVETLVEVPLEAPVKKKETRGRKKMTPERAAVVKAERTARLVQARAKSLAIRRENMYMKTIDKASVAKSKLKESLGEEPLQEIPTPEGFACSTPTLPIKVPEGFAKPAPATQNYGAVDYQKIVDGVYNKFNSRQTTYDENHLQQYGAKIRAEEAKKAQEALALEYKKIEDQKNRFKNMKSSLNILTGGAGKYRPTHRVFGAPKNKKILPKTPSNNPYDQCFN